MTTDRFDYRQIKPGNHGMIKGFILALFIHGVLFFVGGKPFIKPIQYSVQSANGSIDVDLVTALPQPDVAAVKPITSTTEKQQETVKIMPQEEQVTLPQPDVDTAKSTTSTMEKQQEMVKTMPRPSQGTIRTKSNPGYFQNQPPKYPQLAKQMHQEGLVTLMVEVDQKGMPVKVEVKQSSGYQLLDRAALEAVRRWRFQPERIGDIPIESKVTVPIRFRLEESNKKSN
jgi:protein TonB